MTITQEDKEQLMQLAAIKGYKEFKTSFFESSEYEKLLISLLTSLKTISDKKIQDYKLCSKKEILQVGGQIIENHFGNYDLRIPYTEGDKLLTEVMVQFGTNPDSEHFEEIITFILNNVNLKKVTEIPLELDVYAEENGYTTFTGLYGYPVLNTEFYQNLPINLVSEIGITGPCTENSKLNYVHEMVHALIPKGKIQNGLHEEFLPIFLEKVGAKDLSSSDEMIDARHLERILQIKNDVIEKEHLEFNEQPITEIIPNHTYILSTLYATQLFKIYHQGSQKLQKEIDKAIGEVIMGNHTVEDIQKQYELTPCQGSKILRKQIKKYSS